MEIENFFIDVLYLNATKKRESRADQVQAYREEFADDFNDCTPLLIFAVCGCLTAILLVILRKIEQASDKIAECDDQAKPDLDTHNKVPASFCEGNTAKSNTQTMVSPPPPPPSLLSTIPPPGEGSPVEKLQAKSPKMGESTITFRYYADLSKEEIKKPKFWCHYGYPDQRLRSSESQESFPEEKKQKPQSQRHQEQITAQREPSLFQMLSQRQQQDNYVTQIEQKGQNEKSIQILPVGDFLEMNENQDAGKPYNIPETQQHSSQAYVSASERRSRRQHFVNNIDTSSYQTQAKPRRSRHLLANHHRERLGNFEDPSLTKADISNRRHVDSVTIDNFSEVMCLDTAKATIVEDSYSDSTSGSESSSGSSSVNHSNSLFKAKQNFRRARMEKKQNYFKNEGSPRKQNTTKSIRHSKATSPKTSIRANRRGLSKSRISPQINEINKLADAIFRAPLIFKCANYDKKCLQSRNSCLQLGKTSDCFLENCDRCPHKNRVSPHSYQYDSKSDKGRIEDILDANYFKREVAERLKLSKTSRDLKRPISKSLKTPLTPCNIESDVRLTKRPKANLFPQTSSASRLLVVTDQLYNEQPFKKTFGLEHQKSNRSRRELWQQCCTRQTGWNPYENKTLLSLNNSRTRENSISIENGSHLYKKTFQSHYDSQFVAQNIPSTKCTPLKKNTDFSFCKTFPPCPWYNTIHWKTNNDSQRKLSAEKKDPTQSPFRKSIFQSLDNYSEMLDCFAGQIPQGLVLLNYMRKSLGEIHRYYNCGFFSHDKSSGGGVVRVWRHRKYCPYADYCRRMPRWFWKSRSNRHDQQKLSQYNGPSARYANDKCAYSLDCKNFESKPLGYHFLSKKLDLKGHGLHSLTSNYSSKIPGSLNPVSTSRNLTCVDNWWKKQNARSTIMSNKIKRFKTHQPEHGKVFLMESPKFVQDKMLSINTGIKNKSVSHLKNSEYEKQRNGIENALTLAPFFIPGCSENESACRLACSHADSDTSKSRLLPMRPEIKSTDIARGNFKTLKPSRDLYTCKEESVTPVLLSKSENQLHLSASKVRQSAIGTRWTVLSDVESDGLFQVSEITEASIKDTSIESQILQSESSSSHDCSLEKKDQSSYSHNQNRHDVSVKYSGQNVHSLYPSNLFNLTEASKSQCSYNFTCNKSPQMSIVVHNHSSESSSGSNFLNTFTASVRSPNKQKCSQVVCAASVHKELSYVCAGSELKLRKKEGTVTHEANVRKLEKKTSAASKITALSSVESETDTHSTPSPGFVTRIVDAHRSKLYTHKFKETYSKLESPPKSKILDSVNNEDERIQNLSKNIHRLLSYGLNPQPASSTFNNTNGRLSDKTSTIVNSLTGGKGSLSLFRDLTADTRSIYSTPTRKSEENKIKQLLEKNPGQDSFLKKCTSKKDVLDKSSVSEKSQFRRAYQNKTKTGTMPPKAKHWPQNSFNSRGSFSSSKPPSGFSRKSSVSPSSVASPSGGRNMSSPRVNSSLPTWSSPSPLTLTMQNSLRHAQSRPSQSSFSSFKNRLSKVTVNGESIEECELNKSSFGLILNTESTKNEIPRVSLNSVATRLSRTSLIPSETSSSKGVSNTQLCTHPHTRKNKKFASVLTSSKLLSYSLASETNTSKTKLSSAKYKRAQKETKSRLSCICLGGKKTAAKQDVNNEHNLPRRIKNDSNNLKTLKRLEATKFIKMKTNKTSCPALVKNHLINNKIAIIQNNIESKPSLFETEAGNQSAFVKKGRHVKITNTENRKILQKIDFEAKNDFKNNSSSQHEKIRKKSASQNVNSEVQHNITGYHTSLRLSRRQIREKLIENSKSIRPPKNHIKKEKLEKILSKPLSIQNDLNDGEIRGFQGAENSITPEPTLREGKYKHFQRSSSKHKQQVFKKTARSPQGLLKYSRSNSNGKCSGKVGSLSPSRLFTYNKSSTSPLLTSEHVNSSSAWQKSDLTRSETFVGGRVFAACNSNSDITGRAGVPENLKETVRVSTLTQDNKDAIINMKSIGKERKGQSERRTLISPHTRFNSLVNVKDSFQTKGTSAEQKHCLSEQNNGKRKEQSKKVQNRKTETNKPTSCATMRKETKATNMFSKTGSPHPENVIGAKKPVNQQLCYKTKQFRAASRRALNKNRVLGTNNSAAVFPRECWGRMRCSEEMLVLRVPLDLLGLSNRSVGQLQNSAQGLRGEGDGCAETDRVIGEGRDTVRVDINQHFNRLGEDNSSFDWYRPAARSYQQRRPLQRFCRRFPRNSDQPHVRVEGTSMTSNAIHVQACDNNSSCPCPTGAVRALLTLTHDSDQTYCGYRVSETQMFGTSEISSISNENQNEVSGDPANIGTNWFPNSFADCQHIFKSLSCPNLGVKQRLISTPFFHKIRNI